MELELASKPSLEESLRAKFDILETITKPGRGTVLYKLADKEDPNQVICCKSVQERGNAAAEKALLSEATKLEVCQHPNVVKFVQVGHEFSTPYFFMEWVAGENLTQKISRHHQGGFRADHIAWLIYQLAGALDYAHTQGVCHLDIKPSNVLVGTDDAVRLVDFGAAQYVGEDGEHVEASLNYASPDYVRTGIGQPEDDVYSLAVLAYCLFLGVTASAEIGMVIHGQKRPVVIPPHVWKAIQSVISKPRYHGYTPIQFAQVLGQIDTDTPLSNAPLFSSMRNADLVLSRKKHSTFEAVDSWKSLEITLICATLILVSFLVLRNLYTFAFEADSPVVPTEPASFVYDGKVFQPDDTSWFTYQFLNEFTSETPELSKTAVAIVEAYDRKKSEREKQIYLRLSSVLEDEQQAHQIRQEQLTAIKNELITMRRLMQGGKASDSVHIEKQLASAQGRVNTLLQNEGFNRESAITPDEALNLMEVGDVVFARQAFESAWQKATAEAYYYAREVRYQTVVKTLAQVSSLMDEANFKDASTLIENAQEVFPESKDIRTMGALLYARRGEYILRQSLQSDLVVDKSIIQQAYQDVKTFAPERLAQVKAQLKQDIEQGSESQFKAGALSINAKNVTAIVLPDWEWEA
ncbi:protein kinase (plasmid) [Photobacterium sp. GJ3]|uniref:serine/threonine protein kinase n=1 Tax=Photobacterium sp. GJ3 TaxID=2829502 RepID=UPI001B8B9C6F|nr:protein kinase [Photobacterium sp. GJ3]QUJ70019.1 protein kinase [Photobacterium sp. GJ3]